MQIDCHSFFLYYFDCFEEHNVTQSPADLSLHYVSDKEVGISPEFIRAVKGGANCRKNDIIFVID